MKTFTLAAQQITDIQAMVADHATLEMALGNHRAQAFTDLTKMFHDSKADMKTFKAAIEVGLKVHFGKANDATRKAKRTPAPQLIKDWSGRILQTVAAGIKPTTVAGMSEGEVRKELAIVKAIEADGVTRAKLVKAAGGAKATLATVTKAAKKLTTAADPAKAKAVKTEREAMKAVIDAIHKSLERLDGSDARIAYLDFLVTHAKSKPESQVRGEAA